METDNQKTTPPSERPMAAIPFKVVPNSSARLERTLADSEDDEPHHCVSRFLECLIVPLIDLAECFTSYCVLRYLFSVMSIASVVGHLGFQGYLLHEYKEEDCIKLFGALFAISAIFLFVDIAFMWNVIMVEEPYLEKSVLYMVTLCTYCGLFTAAGNRLHDFNTTHYVVSYVLFFCGINVFAVFAFAYAAVSVVYLATYLVENFVKWLQDKCCPEEVAVNEDSIYNAYYFDPSKTTATVCTICLGEYVKDDLVCIGKCHEAHIFHKKCLAEWFAVKLTCPLCNSVAKFH